MSLVQIAEVRPIVLCMYCTEPTLSENAIWMDKVGRFYPDFEGGSAYCGHCISKVEARLVSRLQRRRKMSEMRDSANWREGIRRYDSQKPCVSMWQTPNGKLFRREGGSFLEQGESPEKPEGLTPNNLEATDEESITESRNHAAPHLDRVPAAEAFCGVTIANLNLISEGEATLLILGEVIPFEGERIASDIEVTCIAYTSDGRVCAVETAEYSASRFFALSPLVVSMRPSESPERIRVFPRML